MTCQPVFLEATKRTPLQTAQMAVCVRGNGQERRQRQKADAWTDKCIVGDNVAHNPVDKAVGLLKVAADLAEIVRCLCELAEREDRHCPENEPLLIEPVMQTSAVAMTKSHVATAQSSRRCKLVQSGSLSAIAVR